MSMCLDLLLEALLALGGLQLQSEGPIRLPLASL